MTALPPQLRERGVVCGSSGNHGQGVAYAGRELGIPHDHARGSDRVILTGSNLDADTLRKVVSG